MLALNCSRVRCFVSGVYNTLNTRLCLSTADHMSFRVLDNTLYPVNPVNVFHLRMFFATSLKQSHERDTAIVKEESPKDTVVDSPEYDRFGLLAAQQRDTEPGGKKTRVYNRRKNPVATEWSHTFGTLSNDVDEFLDKYTKKSFAGDKGEEDESEKPYVRLSDKDRKHKPFHYGERISRLGKAGKVYEAMQVLEKQMLKEDRVMPSQFVFTVLIGVLGRAGYTKKAFQLFNKMKKFGLTPEDPTYTALFNACSNSPWPQDGIQRADNLRLLMSEKEYSPNMMTYNAMIKAYARCGDVRKAFAVVDEAIAAGHKPRGPCYCFILMACAADKEAGTKLAIEVWRLMRRNRVRPSIHHYNLLLRSVRDCGLGDAKFAQELLEPNESLPSGRRSSISAAPADLALSGGIASGTEDPGVPFIRGRFGDQTITALANLDDVLSTTHIERFPPHHSGRGCSIFDANVPDLLEPQNSPTSAIRLIVPQSAEGRLALLGGLPGILAQMQRHEAKPDIKTFSLLLELVPSSRDAVNDLMSAMTLHSVQPDADFFAMLIRKRNLRRDYAGAHEALESMRQAGLQPTIRTFGCLAMGCPTLAAARQLVKDIQAAGMVPNVEICEILLFQSHLDFTYKLDLLRVMRSFDIRPSEKMIEKLEKSIQFARKKIVLKERGETVSAFYGSDYFAEGFHRFRIQYRSWLMSMKLEPKVHPWAQFRQPTPSLERMNAPDEFPPNVCLKRTNKLEAEELPR